MHGDSGWMVMMAGLAPARRHACGWAGAGARRRITVSTCASGVPSPADQTPRRVYPLEGGLGCPAYCARAPAAAAQGRPRARAVLGRGRRRRLPSSCCCCRAPATGPSLCAWDRVGPTGRHGEEGARGEHPAGARQGHESGGQLQPRRPAGGDGLTASCRRHRARAWGAAGGARDGLGACVMARGRDAGGRRGRWCKPDGPGEGPQLMVGSPHHNLAI
jgi:hypothetical protein